MTSLDGKDDAASQALRALDRRSSPRICRIARLARRQGRGRQAAQGGQAARARRRDRRAARAQGDGATTPARTSRWPRCCALQGKPARDIKRYLDAARAKADKDWARDLALADGAACSCATASSTTRRRRSPRSTRATASSRHRATCARGSTSRSIALAQNKAADAKPLVDADPRRAARARRRQRAGAPSSRPPVAQDRSAATRGRRRDKTPGPVGPCRPTGSSRPSPTPPAVTVGGGARTTRCSRRRNKIADTNCTQGDGALRQGARAEAERRRGADRHGLLPHRREAVRERVLEVPRRARGVAAVRAGAVRHRRGVPAAGPQGAGDRGVQGVPRGLSRRARRRRSSSSGSARDHRRRRPVRPAPARPPTPPPAPAPPPPADAGAPAAARGYVV